MTLDQACNIMEQYAQHLDRDSLDSLEHMVKYMRSLTPEQLEALDVFMAATQETA
jgi:hypothetical protein